MLQLDSWHRPQRLGLRLLGLQSWAVLAEPRPEISINDLPPNYKARVDLYDQPSVQERLKSCAWRSIGASRERAAAAKVEARWRRLVSISKGIVLRMSVSSDWSPQPSFIRRPWICHFISLPRHQAARDIHSPSWYSTLIFADELLLSFAHVLPFLLCPLRSHTHHIVNPQCLEKKGTPLPVNSHAYPIPHRHFTINLGTGPLWRSQTNSSS